MFKHNLKNDNTELRQELRTMRIYSEKQALQYLQKLDTTDATIRDEISTKVSALIEEIRATQTPDLLSLFLAEYNLSSSEGLALMTLAETLLRVPDNKTRDQLFSDKIANKQWSKHSSSSKSAIVNIATMALNIADMLISKGHNKSLKDKIKQALAILTNPIMRITTANIMEFFGNQFVFAQNINNALKKTNNTQLCSFDMLGEAAWTANDAQRYYQSYEAAIIAIGKQNKTGDIFTAHGISIKLSALHPQYNYMHKHRVINELAPRVLLLVKLAQKYNIGLNIDAEEANRLDISLDVIDYIAQNIANSSWQGLGIVVQAYQKRAPLTIDWLYECSKRHKLKLMVRLVKGAYWDSEIKQSQVDGETHYPVYTKKINTDYSYLICAQKLLNFSDRIYPQFASHNAHSLIAIHEMAKDNQHYEIQRLHGMGESLHRLLATKYKIKSRIYAPVGVHKDLLAYLVRRLLENGANSSFINHLFDKTIAPAKLAEDVFSIVNNDESAYNSKIKLPQDVYLPMRENSFGIALNEPEQVTQLQQNIAPWIQHSWLAKSIIANNNLENTEPVIVKNPANLTDKVGEVIYANEQALQQCVKNAVNAFDVGNIKYNEINNSLRMAAKLFKDNQDELMALIIREAGKTYQDAIDEVREAIDFLNYYANLSAQEFTNNARQPLGVFVCISPWNFPLAIFTGQVVAALASGNCVIAKPAEDTSLIAYRATQLLHQAGISEDTLQLVLGTGATIGAYLTKQQAISGVAFTGSTAVANLIKKTLTQNNNAGARLIAETGGLNAMVVDSTALAEQVVKDVLDSAFKSAGQRCSALRLLIVQQEVADKIIQIITGAMQELTVGDPIYLNTDCGPVINQAAQTKLQNYINKLAQQGKLIKQTKIAQNNGYFVAPAIIKLDSIDEINEEFFGPILHVVSYQKDNLKNTINALNNKGFGLTFGMHSRIESQIDFLSSQINAGNIYVNRNQVGAVVGSQPFGGEGLSGTGPKAGGHKSLHGYSKNSQSIPINMTKFSVGTAELTREIQICDWRGFDDWQLNNMVNKFIEITPNYHTYLLKKLNTYQIKHELPGVTGESNSLTYKPKGVVLCLGPGEEAALAQTISALAFGNTCISTINQINYQRLLDFNIPSNSIYLLNSMPTKRLLLSDIYDAIFWTGEINSLEQVIINSDKQIIAVINSMFDSWRLVVEKVITVDTTAAGGNASLLAL